MPYFAFRRTSSHVGFWWLPAASVPAGAVGAVGAMARVPGGGGGWVEGCAAGGGAVVGIGGLAGGAPGGGIPGGLAGAPAGGGLVVAGPRCARAGRASRHSRAIRCGRRVIGVDRQRTLYVLRRTEPLRSSSMSIRPASFSFE